jgi:hypothetical protein
MKKKVQTPEEIAANLAAVKAMEQKIANWKKQYGEIYLLEVDGRQCYLRQPDRKIISMARSLSQGDYIAAQEHILDACWLEGDEEIRTNDTLFLNIATKLEGLIEAKESTLKKI